jgi:hypothetical protein
MNGVGLSKPKSVDNNHNWLILLNFISEMRKTEMSPAQCRSKYYKKGILWNFVFILIATYFLLLGLNRGFEFFYIAGEERAEKQDYFPVLREPSSHYEVVVIRNYGDYLYAVPFNRDDKEFKRKLFILKMSEMSQTPLTIEKVEPLIKPKPIETKPQQP